MPQNLLRLKIRIQNASNHPLPVHETTLSAGVDLRAFIDQNVVLQPGERRLLPTGLKIEIPAGFEGQVRPRSGLAFKHGVTVLNSPGTIDADYRGEVKVLLINHGNEPFTICPGDRIAQLVVAAHQRIEFVQSEELSDSVRGAGGYGHTGTK
ncbi:MAG: dUTP pyrophosphatase [Bacteroidia bacterium]